MCLPSSKIFVATDASPKDAEMQSTVASLALQKKITVDFFLTGRCTRRRRDAGKRQCMKSEKIPAFTSTFASV